ncbi:spermidine/putrescine ABC transporter permease PotB [Pantoea sp. Aalb]|uniref:spermidine/putrescine ABC transporter permease PotB n=1 Tax=Pantoea sp. Aalb TaxID=2576762 RepID=UPI0013239A42|nr:spermidine/putrescine ABC transporter permease PotB [Pantoea sp. Aalb]MXP67449.1 spermidine/putrescine ABC transporter permease PotB [Pantoea sp. Aalb]
MNIMCNYLKKIIITLIFTWLALFVLLPNLMILITSFLKSNNVHFISMPFTLNNYRKLFDPLYIQVLLHSLYIAFIATVCCLLLGYYFAWCLNQLSIYIRPLMLFLLIIPFWINSLIRIYGLKIFLSTRGWLNHFLLWLGIIDIPFHIMYTTTAIILGLIYILFPFMVLPLYSSLEKIDKSYLEAARDLGASNLQIFIQIILPLTLPGIIAGWLLVFIPAMGLFYITDLMGGAKNLMIGNIIKNQFLNIRDWPFGSATSVVMIFLMGLMLLIYWYTIRFLDDKVNL